MNRVQTIQGIARVARKGGHFSQTTIDVIFINCYSDLIQSYYGIGGTVLTWFKNFLADRQQYLLFTEQLLFHALSNNLTLWSFLLTPVAVQVFTYFQQFMF